MCIDGSGSQSNFFHFHAVFGKNLAKIIGFHQLLRVGALFWEILDPPLMLVGMLFGSGT